MSHFVFLADLDFNAILFFSFLGVVIIDTSHMDLFTLYTLPVNGSFFDIAICLLVFCFKMMSCYLAQDWPQTHNSFDSVSRMLELIYILLKVKYVRN